MKRVGTWSLLHLLAECAIDIEDLRYALQSILAVGLAECPFLVERVSERVADAAFEDRGIHLNLASVVLLLLLVGLPMERHAHIAQATVGQARGRSQLVKMVERGNQSYI